MPIRIVAYYERWSGRLAELLARNASVQATPIIEDLPRSEWRLVRQWARWRPQPEHGWTPAPTVPIVVQPETPPSWSPVKAWATWTPQARHGWTTPSEQDQALRVPDTHALPVKAWATWRPQPQYGWTQSSDQNVSLAIPGPSWTPIKPWARWAPQPQYGWSVPSDLPAVVQVEEGPTWRPPVVWAHRWTRQPRLG